MKAETTPSNVILLAGCFSSFGNEADERRLIKLDIRVAHDMICAGETFRVAATMWSGLQYVSV
jgi:hypothetical protein